MQPEEVHLLSCLRRESRFRFKKYFWGVSDLPEPQEIQSNRAAYKVTLLKGHHGVWIDTEYNRMTELLKASDCRFFIEVNCLQIVSGDRDKGTGIEEMCGWLGISVGDVLAVGNDKEDVAMERVCGAYLEV